MNESIVVVVDVRVESTRVDQWLPLAIEHLQRCVAQPGMLRFWVHRDDDDPAHFLFYEEWADRADLARSMRAPWYRAYVAEVEGLLAAPRVMTVYRRVEAPWEPLGPTGLPAAARPGAVGGSTA